MTVVFILLLASSLLLVVVFTLRMRDIATEYTHIESEAARKGIQGDTKELMQTWWGYLACVVFLCALVAYSLFNLV